MSERNERKSHGKTTNKPKPLSVFFNHSVPAMSKTDAIPTETVNYDMAALTVILGYAILSLLYKY